MVDGVVVVVAVLVGIRAVVVVVVVTRSKLCGKCRLLGSWGEFANGTPVSERWLFLKSNSRVPSA